MENKTSEDSFLDAVSTGPRIKIEQPEREAPAKPPLLPGILILGVLVMTAVYILMRLPRRPEAPPFFLPLNITSYEKKVEISKDGETWLPVTLQDTVDRGVKIRTGPSSAVTLEAPDKMRLRLKSDSEMEITRAHLLLTKGVLLGATRADLKENEQIRLATPVLTVRSSSLAFLLEHDLQNKKSWLGILRGSAGVETAPRHQMILRRLEKTEARPAQKRMAAEKILKADWNRLQEVYDLMERSSQQEAEQRDLAKHAGSLFQYVFDHGSFYTPDHGYANREFRKDPQTGETALEVEYDVFPPGSVAGVYFKIRGLDLSGFEGLRFQAREKKGEGAPDSIRLELKSRGQKVRAYAPRYFPEGGRTLDWQFNVEEETGIDEMALVFAHVTAGAGKKGVLVFKNFELIPRSSERVSTAPPAPSAPAKPPSPVDDLDRLVEQINSLHELTQQHQEARSREN